MRVYHIIEQTADQQTLEIRAESLGQAIELYLNKSLIGEPWQIIERVRHGVIRVTAKEEQCTIIVHNERIAFAQWTHARGLY